MPALFGARGWPHSFLPAGYALYQLSYTLILLCFTFIVFHASITHTEPLSKWWDTHRHSVVNRTMCQTRRHRLLKLRLGKSLFHVTSWNVAACGDVDRKRSVHMDSRARRDHITCFPNLQTGFCGNRGFLDSTLDSCEKYFAPSTGPALRESLSEIPGQRAAGDWAPRIALPLLPCSLLEESEYVTSSREPHFVVSHPRPGEPTGQSSKLLSPALVCVWTPSFPIYFQLGIVW